MKGATPTTTLSAFLWLLFWCGSIIIIWNKGDSLADALALPEQELVNRRKSPALWRYDLSPRDDHHDDDDDFVKQPFLTSQTPLIIQQRQPPEVMAPVGGWPQLHAAIANGADAVYVGLSAFSARARAANFDPSTELPRAVQTCHDAGVKLYVALNTLVFPNELEEVEGLIRLCAKANVDALIVQDLGVARLARRIAPPQLELHASTQQTITSADGANFIAQWMGSTRVVLGRELSVAEIESVASQLHRSYHLQQAQQHNEQDNNQQQLYPINAPVEVEAFVHGALCVSYSGQCFSSEAWGGRSANRGQCAQACRLPYGLVDNGVLRELGDFSYLLSPQDLCGLDHVPALVRAGVACLKIEGRLKDAAYVAATTRAYRNAVDQAWKEYLDEIQQNATNDNSPPSILQSPITSGITRQLSLPDETVSKTELAQLFSRGQDEDHDGLSPGFFDGSQHQHIVRGRSPRHRGVHVGRILEGSSWKNGLLVALDDIYHNDDKDSQNHPPAEIKRGDGLVIDRGMAQEEELGGPIFDIQNLPQRYKGKQRVVSIKFSKAVEKKWKTWELQAKKMGAHVTELAPTEAHVWKTSDAVVDKKMKRLSEAPLPRLSKVAHVTVKGSIGTPLVVTIRDDATDREGIGATEGVLEPAQKNGLDSKSIEKAIGTLGNTEWTLASDQTIDMTGVDAAGWCPASWIKEARRKAMVHLQSQFRSTEQVSSEHAEEEKSLENNGGSVTNQLLDTFSRRSKYEEEAQEESGVVSKPKISVLARNYGQVDAICNMIDRGVADDVVEIIVDFLEVDGMRDAVQRIREAGVKAVVASPRIIKPGESGIWRTLLRLEADGLLVRSTGLLHRMMQLGGKGATVNVGKARSELDSESGECKVTIPELIGDFSLNVANPLTAWELLTYGCDRVTASYDLNANGITELLMGIGQHEAAKVEVVVHAHLPVFHTEHCVFARFLTNGNSYLDCGHACTRHNVHLRDQTGADNLVLADMGCRNTVFASESQSGVFSLKEWAAGGAKRFRIELVDEGRADAELIVNGYLSVLNGKTKASELWEILKTVRDSNGRAGGVSYGSLRNAPVRRAGEIA